MTTRIRQSVAQDYAIVTQQFSGPDTEPGLVTMPDVSVASDPDIYFSRPFNTIVKNFETNPLSLAFPEGSPPTPATNKRGVTGLAPGDYWVSSDGAVCGSKVYVPDPTFDDFLLVDIHDSWTRLAVYSDSAKAYNSVPDDYAGGSPLVSSNSVLFNRCINQNLRADPRSETKNFHIEGLLTVSSVTDILVWEVCMLTLQDSAIRDNVSVGGTFQLFGEQSRNVTRAGAPLDVVTYSSMRITRL